MTSHKVGNKNSHYISMNHLLTLPIRKRPHICARFGLGDKILMHLLANVEMTSVYIMKFFTWM
jgi:hypothetical protein